MSPYLRGIAQRDALPRAPKSAQGALAIGRSPVAASTRGRAAQKSRAVSFFRVSCSCQVHRNVTASLEGVTMLPANVSPFAASGANGKRGSEPSHAEDWAFVGVPPTRGLRQTIPGNALPAIDSA